MAQLLAEKLECLEPTHVKDSQQIINETKPLVLPPDSLLFTVDAKSMYNNIDRPHTIKESAGGWKILRRKSNYHQKIHWRQ